MSRRNIHNKKFSAEAVCNLKKMADTVDAAYGVMLENLETAHRGALADISNAYNSENHINELRNTLRESEIEEMENGKKNYQESVYYLDVVNELERMGDFIINISQDLKKSFVNK